MTYTYAGRWGPEAVIDKVGNAIPNASVQVYASDGTTPATLYRTRTKAATAANPVAYVPPATGETGIDSRGNLTLHADPGEYVLAISRHGTLVATVGISVPIDPVEADDDPLVGYVTLATDQTITGQKSFTKYVNNVVAAGAGGTETVTVDAGIVGFATGVVKAVPGGVADLTVTTDDFNRDGATIAGGYVRAELPFIGGGGAGEAHIAAAGNTIAFGYSYASGGKTSLIATHYTGSVALGTANSWLPGGGADPGTGARLIAYGYGSFAHGDVVAGTTAASDAEIQAYGSGASASGHAFAFTGAASIQANAQGSFAHGNAFAAGTGEHGASMLASGLGSFALGRAEDINVASGSIRSTGKGTLAEGFSSGGLIEATGDGSFVQGFAKSLGGTAELKTESSSNGAFAQGLALSEQAGAVSKIRSTGYGTVAHGYAAGRLGTAQLIAQNYGSVAHGFVEATGHVGATATIVGGGYGGLASGYTSAQGDSSVASIASSGGGTVALGAALSSAASQGSITSSGYGSFAQGYVVGRNGGVATVNAHGYGALAQGWSEAVYSGGTATIVSYGAGMSRGEATSGAINAVARMESSIQGVAMGNVRSFASGKTALLFAQTGFAFGDVRSDIVDASIKADGYRGAFAFGYAKDGTIRAANFGAFAGGTAKSILGAPATIQAAGSGSMVGGYAFSKGATGSSLVESRGGGAGGMAFGYAYADPDGIAKIGAGGPGAIALGYAWASGVGSTAEIKGDGWGGLVTGAVFARSGESALLESGGNGSVAQGYITRDGSIRAVGPFGGSFAQGTADTGLIQADERGAFAQGHVTGGTIKASAKGSFAEGFALASDPTGTAVIETTSTARGGLAFGYATADAGESSLIQAGSYGSLAMGYVGQGGQIISSNSAFALGMAYGPGAKVAVTGFGGIALGYAYASGTGVGEVTASRGFTVGAVSAFSAGTAKVDAPNRKGFAFGYAFANTAGEDALVRGTNGVAFGIASAEGGNATILASGYGSFTHGEVRAIGGAAAMTASGNGSFAGGYISTPHNITASAFGAFAHGFATGGDIVASANNAVQFGPGTNSVANSLQVGSGVHIHGGIPGAPANGDIWVDAGVVKIRSNGITVSL